MSKSSKHAVERYQFPNTRKLWHDGAKLTKSLGCDQCHYLRLCGGLQVEAAAFDCLSYCRCAAPAKCDNVCPRNVQYLVARAQEVRGFELDNVPDAPALAQVQLPSLVPMVYHSYARKRTPVANTVALSLYEFFNKHTGELRFKSRQAVLDRFKVDDRTTIVLSGTDEDPPLERWWWLRDRLAIVRGLRELGVKLITAPNYSLFDDVPRLDNMYNMKRIALTSSEIQCEGVLCGLHLNARTDRDWDRWIEYLNARREYEYVAFEFGTGAGARQRTPWYVDQLCRLAKEVQRPLNLVIRGGLAVLPVLAKAFAGISFIDTAAFIKAQHRQRAKIVDGGLVWEKSPTPKGEPIDELFEHNVTTVHAYVETVLTANGAAGVLVQNGRRIDATNDAGYEALETDRLAQARAD